MEEPEEFNLLLSLVGGIVFLFVFAFGGFVYYLLGQPKVVENFPTAIPIRIAVLSLLGVLGIVLAIGGIRSFLHLFFS